MEHPDHGEFCQYCSDLLPIMHYHGAIKPPASASFGVVTCTEAECDILQGHVNALWEHSRQAREAHKPTASAFALKRAMSIIGLLQWLEGFHGESSRRARPFFRPCLG